MISVHSMKRPMIGGQPYDFEFKGLSTDTKPSVWGGNDVGVNSLFFEQDTGDFYYYDGENWNKIGSDPSGDGYEITNPVLTMTIVNNSGGNQYQDTTLFDNIDCVLAYETIEVLPNTTRVFDIVVPQRYDTNSDTLVFKLWYDDVASVSSLENCTTIEGGIYITDPTKPASITLTFN